MKRILLPMFASLLLSCNAQVHVTTQVISSDFFGFGVEWDPYDEALAWGCEVSDADWEELYKRLDYMCPQYVRCMINSPYTYFDDGSYEPDRNIAGTVHLLDYCQSRGITVIYGEYNPPAWEMKDSEDWVRMSVDNLRRLVVDRGYSCIKHFVIFNEPDGNWASTDGDYALWQRMYLRFAKEMAKYPGLAGVTLAGPDAVLNYKNPASVYDCDGWISQTALDLDILTGIYDIHAYPGREYVYSGKFGGDVRRVAALVPEGKRLIFGEAGYKYDSPEDAALKAEYLRRVEGHPFTKGSDCNMLVYDYFYSLDMPVFLMEAVNNGASGAAAWMLDDAMHSSGDSGKTEDVKIWGMWNILGSEVFGDPSEEDIRPWYYTWSLMCRYFPRGCDIVRVDGSLPGGVFAAACRTAGGGLTLALVNSSKKAVEIVPSLGDVTLREVSGETGAAPIGDPDGRTGYPPSHPCSLGETGATPVDDTFRLHLFCEGFTEVAVSKWDGGALKMPASSFLLLTNMY